MLTLLIVSAFLVGLINPTTAQDVESFYHGKQVRIIVSFSSGGGSDHRLLVSGAEIGRPFLVSKSVPTDRVSALRAAFDATMKDAEFLADAEKQRLLIGPDDGATVAKRIVDIYAAAPEVIARAREIAGD